MGVTKVNCYGIGVTIDWAQYSRNLLVMKQVDGASELPHGFNKGSGMISIAWLLYGPGLCSAAGCTGLLGSRACSHAETTVQR